jgi:hypothetical protein
MTLTLALLSTPNLQLPTPKGLFLNVADGTCDVYQPPNSNVELLTVLSVLGERVPRLLAA